MGLTVYVGKLNIIELGIPSFRLPENLERKKGNKQGNKFHGSITGPSEKSSG
jgi:hypothetical protein